MKVADQYEKYTYNSGGYTGTEHMVSLVLPLLYTNGIYNNNDSYAYVNEYSISKSSDAFYKDPSFIKILSINEGESFRMGHADGGYQPSGITVKKDTSIKVNGIVFDIVLVIIHLDMQCPQSGIPLDSCASMIEYYAKGVGLIRRDVGGYYPEDHMETKFEILDYHINR